MPQDQLGFGSGLFGNKKTATSQPGTYPLGVGGGIAQMIASRREGVYAFMSPAQQADLRAKLEAQLADLSKQEYEWRKGLVKDKTVHADQLLKLYELKTGIGATGAKIQLGKQDILAGVYAEMGVTMFEHGITEADPTQIPGLTGPQGLTGEVSVAAAGLELTESAFTEFNGQGSIAQKAAYLSKEVGKPIEAIINKTENYGARMGVGAGHGKLMTTRMAQSVAADQAYAHLGTFMKGAGTSGADQKEIMALFGDMHIARGDATFGVTNSTDALADASALKKEVGRKVTTSKYITDSLQKGVGFDRETELADYLFGYYKNMEEGKDPTDAYQDLPPPQWLGDKESMLRAQLQRVDRSDPYADQVIRVAGLQGFDEYKAALGIKGNGYEANRKAAMIMAKDPKAASAAFKFFTEGKRSGVPDAKLDVMYRQYLAQGGAPEGGLFGKKFDSESVRRASYAGMTAVDIAGMGQTIGNYIQTGEFKYIQAPTEARYKEFRDQWIAENAPEGAFVGEDGSFTFVSELLKGQFSNAAASWMEKQKVLDRNPDSKTFGALVPEEMGAATYDLMAKDAAYLKEKATALTMARDNIDTADKTLDFGAPDTSTARREGDIELGGGAEQVGTEKEKAMALFEEMAKIYKSEDERQFRRDIYQKALREDASYDEALSKAKKAVFSEKVQPFTEEQRLTMEALESGDKDRSVIQEVGMEPVTAESSTPVNKPKPKKKTVVDSLEAQIMGTASSEDDEDLEALIMGTTKPKTIVL